METILFICTGNTCRSCMAEGIFNHLTGRDSSIAGRFRAVSAGIAAFSGQPASDCAVQVLKEEWDIDIGSHSSRMAEPELLESASLILAMTRAHKNAIVSAYPHLAPRVFTLKEYTCESEAPQFIKEYNYTLDISDPFGMSVNVYRLCAREIRNEVEKLIVKLKKSMI